jgi:hypothetical protein
VRIVFATLLLVACAQEASLSPTLETDVRFQPYDVVLETPAQVAAYQVTLAVSSGDAVVVGIEGGDPPGFQEPPYYDPAALTEGRVVLASFNTDAVLAPGSHRVATVHMQETGPAAEYVLDLVVAADDRGRPAPAHVQLLPKGQDR